MDNCIFCKIVKGELPNYSVYEDKEFFAFLDINPRNKGHTLVIPKKHFKWVWDVPNLGEYYNVVGKIANTLRKTMKTESVVSIVSGEEISHAHVWLIPRYDNDGHGGFLDINNVKKIPKEEMEEIADRIRSSL